MSNPTQAMADQGIDYVYESTLKGCFVTVCLNGTRYNSTAGEIGLYEEVKKQVRDSLRKEGLLKHDPAQQH